MNAVVRILLLGLLTVLLSNLLGWMTAWGSPTIDQLLPNKESLEIVVKKSFLVKLKAPAERVSVVAPEIADVQILDPKEILVTGVSVGETSLIIWTADKKARTLDLRVLWNTEAIQKTIRQILPDEVIEVISLKDGVALQGQVRNLQSLDKALEITQSYTPKVVNLLQVPGIQQVLLKVKIAEVASSFRSEAGINFLINRKSFTGGSSLGNLVSGDLSSGNVDMSDVVTLFFGFPKSDVRGFIQALKSKGWIHVLAQPNLIARSGETANFLAGGEFPIPVVQSGSMSNAVTIEYKEFGVRLSFTPTVLGDGNIHLDISPEVSDLDFSNGIKIGGFVVPTLVIRRAHTVVQLGDGQTFAIAGLLSQNKQKTRRKIPGLGEVPILGSLFSGKEISEKETELLIMVTPHLIAPLENGEAYEMPKPEEEPESGEPAVKPNEEEKSPEQVQPPASSPLGEKKAKIRAGRNIDVDR